MKHILLVDDHPSLMIGTKLLLEQEEDIHVVIAGSGLQALEYWRTQSFDVALLDLHMPSLNGIDLTHKIMQLDPNAVILIYTGYEIEPHINLLIEAGISGFVPKTASNQLLVTAIRCAMKGETVIPTSLFRVLRKQGGLVNDSIRGSSNVSINEKEFIILKNLVLGKNNKEIAQLLVSSQRSMEYALTRLFQKLNVKSRREAVLKAKQLGILSAEDFV